MSEPRPDDERLYRLIQQEAWLDALGWLHRAWRTLDGDARARRAAEVFDAAFFGDLEARPPEALERRLMLHHGHMRALPAAPYARLTEALARKEDDVDAVQSLERLASAEHSGAPEAGGGVRREEVALDGVPLRLAHVHGPKGRPDARRSLFKSPQERAFFEALRVVFPTHLIYPNAALNTTLDFEQIGGRLTEAERHYFFRALVDAVVVDPLDDLRPVYFFELDSAHHDQPERRRNDALKEAILAKAGQSLFRLRREKPATGGAAFAEALRAVVKRCS